MPLDRWQAPDRDSPTTVKFEANVELASHLDALLQMEGHGGTKEDEVKAVTGQEISRPRRWHKIFERMGLLYLDQSGATKLTQLGETIRQAKNEGGRTFRRNIARAAISVLRKYQLRNPADQTGSEFYPSNADIHPYWAIWKAAVELDGRLHWDELNRVLMWVLRDCDLDAAISKIKAARREPSYSPESNGTPAARLGERAYDQSTTTDGRDPSGQVRDQKTTPWFKRAGFGELMLIPPGRDGAGYWTIHPDVADLLKQAVSDKPPPFIEFSSEQEWFDFYGQIDMAENENDIYEGGELLNDLPDEDVIWKQVNALVAGGASAIVLSGPPGTSKSWYAHKIAAKLVDGDGNRVRFIQFHPSYSYDDFVEGYVPVIKDGHSTFKATPKIFLNLSKRAAETPGKLHVLLIDELNRGDPSKVFGELLTFIERDYRKQTFMLPYSGRSTSIPENLLILATMNPYDKSVSDLDDALERRFDRIALDPNIETLREMLSSAKFDGQTIGKVIDFFKLANDKSRHGLGHAFFAKVQDEVGLKSLWNYKLRFVLEKSFRFEPDVFKELRESYMSIFADATGIA